MLRPVDKIVLQNLKSGDSKAFELVFKNWYEPLVHFANEYIPDLDSSRNIIQNIFMHLWEKHEQVDPESNLRSYLYMATRNACISHLRHLRVESSYFEKSLKNSSDLQLNYEALQQLDFEQVDLAKLEQIIQETIASLPERCREVFTMSRLNNLKNREIAEKLDISVKAVEANISRAIIKLRENTKAYLPELIFLLYFHVQN